MESEAANDTRDWKSVRVISPQAERVIGQINPLPFTRMEGGPMGDFLATEDESLGPTAAQVFGVRVICAAFMSLR